MMQRFVRRSFNQLRRSSWHGMVVLLCDEKLRVRKNSLNTGIPFMLFLFLGINGFGACFGGK